MVRIIEYIIFFIILILLQVFLFSNLNLSLYIHPLVFVAFIIFLPMETPSIIVLLCGFIIGVIMDLATGAGGLNTVSTLPIAFLRSFLMNIVIGRDEVKGGGVPIAARIGINKYVKYTGLIIFIHCLLFFTFDSLTFQYIHLTILRVLCSSVVSWILIYFSQMLILSANLKGRE